jgi:hypothetical protein
VGPDCAGSVHTCTKKVLYGFMIIQYLIYIMNSLLCYLIKQLKNYLTFYIIQIVFTCQHKSIALCTYDLADKKIHFVLT